MDITIIFYNKIVRKIIYLKLNNVFKVITKELCQIKWKKLEILIKSIIFDGFFL